MSIKQANRTLIPHTLSKKPPPAKKVASVKVPSRPSATAGAKMLADYNNSDEDDEDITEGSNFFSLDTDQKDSTVNLFCSFPLTHLNKDSDIYSIPPPPPSFRCYHFSVLCSTQPCREWPAKYRSSNVSAIWNSGMYHCWLLYLLPLLMKLKFFIFLNALLWIGIHPPHQKIQRSSIKYNSKIYFSVQTSLVQAVSINSIKRYAVNSHSNKSFIIN